jgi:hypothetical protein
MIGTIRCNLRSYELLAGFDLHLDQKHLPAKENTA